MDNLAEIEGRYRRRHLATTRIESAAGRSSRALSPAAAGRAAPSMSSGDRQPSGRLTRTPVRSAPAPDTPAS